MTYRTLLRLLAEAGIDDADREASRLLTHFCGASPALLMADPDREYAGEGLEDAITRRRAREPLAYILGQWDFFGETYAVSPDCLIPRSDTELLVEEAIARLPKGGRFADLCTGSGCVAISTLCHRPDASGIAIDLFPRTLALAAENAARNGVSHRLALRQADVLDPSVPATLGSLDLILSNPPYIASSVADTLSPELFHEPRAALDGGEDGLRFYRAILKHYAPCLAPLGLFLFELGYDQADALGALAAENGFACRILRDLGGNPRVAVIGYERSIP